MSTTVRIDIQPRSVQAYLMSACMHGFESTTRLFAHKFWLFRFRFVISVCFTYTQNHTFNRISFEVWSLDYYYEMQVACEWGDMEKKRDLWQWDVRGYDEKSRYLQSEALWMNDSSTNSWTKQNSNCSNPFKYIHIENSLYPQFSWTNYRIHHLICLDIRLVITITLYFNICSWICRIIISLLFYSPNNNGAEIYVCKNERIV